MKITSPRRSARVQRRAGQGACRCAHPQKPAHMQNWKSVRLTSIRVEYVRTKKRARYIHTCRCPSADHLISGPKHARTLPNVRTYMFGAMIDDPAVPAISPAVRERCGMNMRIYCVTDTGIASCHHHLLHRKKAQLLLAQRTKNFRHNTNCYRPCVVL